MKKFTSVSVFLVCLLALGLAFTACDNGGDTKKDPDGVDSAIVGKWYDTQAHADADGTTGLMFEIKSDGTFSGGNYPYNNNSYGTKCTTASSTITTFKDDTDWATAKYSISGTALTLTAGEHAWNGITPVTYYKKSSVVDNNDTYVLEWGIWTGQNYSYIASQFQGAGYPLTSAGNNAGYLTGNAAAKAISIIKNGYSFNDSGDKTGEFDELLNYTKNGIGVPSALKTAMNANKDKLPIGGVFYASGAGVLVFYIDKN